MSPKGLYRCFNGGDEHVSLQDSMKCCCSIEKLWECSECGCIYDDLEQAEECCLEEL